MLANLAQNEYSKKIGSSSLDFEVIEEIGKGAHGVVYKVISKKNKQIYVMKKINFNNLKAHFKRDAL